MRQMCSYLLLTSNRLEITKLKDKIFMSCQSLSFQEGSLQVLQEMLAFGKATHDEDIEETSLNKALLRAKLSAEAD